MQKIDDGGMFRENTHFHVLINFKIERNESRKPRWLTCCIKIAANWTVYCILFKFTNTWYFIDLLDCIVVTHTYPNGRVNIPPDIFWVVRSLAAVLLSPMLPSVLTSLVFVFPVDDNHVILLHCVCTRITNYDVK